MLFILAIVICLLVLIIGAANSSSRKNNYRIDPRNYDKAMNSGNPKRVKEYLDSLEDAYSELSSKMSSQSHDHFNTNIADMREHYKEVVQEKWEEEANRILDKFLEYYLTITDESPSFREVDIAYKAKEKCLKYWYRYWQSVHNYEPTFYPKKYIKDYLGSDYDECMQDSSALKKKLDSCILRIQPEYKRKMKLINDILSSIREAETVKRADLLKREFDNCSAKEISSTYFALVKEHKVYEYKIGNCYYSSITEKGSKSVHSKPHQPIAENPYSSMPENDIERIISRFREIGIEPVDKRPQQGYLWFASTPESESIYQELKAYGIQINKASSSKALGGKPGFFLK